LERDDSISPGVQFYPEAYGESSMMAALAVMAEPSFYRVYMRYVVAVTFDIGQLVHFRPTIVKEVQYALQGKLVASTEEIARIVWCALALSTERYFAEKAQNHEWTAAEKDRLFIPWLSFLAEIYVPSAQAKLKFEKVQSWVEDFRYLQKQSAGPMRGCQFCTSKCAYHWEASELISDFLTRYELDEAVGRRENGPATKSAANYCWELSERLTGRHDLDFAFCLASHYLLKKEQTKEEAPAVMPEDMLFVLSKKIRAHLEDLARSPD
jgi:hypothetical protein